MLLISNQHELLQQQLKPLYSQNVRVSDFFEDLQVCRELMKTLNLFLKLPSFRGRLFLGLLFYLGALHWSHSQMDVTPFFKENGHIVGICRRSRDMLM